VNWGNGGVHRNAVVFFPSSGRSLATSSDHPTLCQILHQYHAVLVALPPGNLPSTSVHHLIYSPSLPSPQCASYSSVDYGMLHRHYPPIRARPSWSSFVTPSPSPLCSLASSQPTVSSSCPLSFASHACADPLVLFSKIRYRWAAFK